MRCDIQSQTPESSSRSPEIIIRPGKEQQQGISKRRDLWYEFRMITD